MSTSVVEPKADALVHREPRNQDDGWASDPRNPRLWTARRRVLTVVLVSSIGFVCTMGSSIYAPGRDQVQQDFQVSEELSILPISLYNVGMGLGPLVASPLSETLGRRFVYLVCLPVFVAFVLGSGFTQSLLALSVCRLFAGIFASPSVAIAAATIADLYEPERRAIPLIMYYTAPTLGAICGPLVGGFVVNVRPWRWTAWTTLFFAVPVSLPILLTRESYKKVLLSHSAAASIASFSWGNFFRQNLLRPLDMLITEPIVSFVCLYMSFQFALLYLFIVTSPSTYEAIYDIPASTLPLTFLGLIIGGLLAPIPLLLIELYYHQPRSQRLGRLPPEARLAGAQLGSICLPLGLLMFALTARPSIPLFVPMCAQGLVMIGSLNVYIPCGLYLMETYGARYGASASGANSFLRYALAGSFPLFSGRMFAVLGTRSASLLLMGITVALAAIPWVFARWGHQMRARRRYRIVGP